MSGKGVQFEWDEVADLQHTETEERWFSIGCASNGARFRRDEDPTDIGPQINACRKPALSGGLTNNQPIEDSDIPAEIDFSKGVRGFHHIPAGATIWMPPPTKERVGILLR